MLIIVEMSIFLLASRVHMGSIDNFSAKVPEVFFLPGAYLYKRIPGNCVPTAPQSSGQVIQISLMM